MLSQPLFCGLFAQRSYTNMNNLNNAKLLEGGGAICGGGFLMCPMLQLPPQIMDTIHPHWRGGARAGGSLVHRSPSDEDDGDRNTTTNPIRRTKMMLMPFNTKLLSFLFVCYLGGAAAFCLRSLLSPNTSSADGYSRPKLSYPQLHSLLPASTKLQMTDSSSDDISAKVRYLGSGPDAIIRPGVVLVAPVHEYDHFLMKAAVFVYAIGLDDNEDMVIRGEVYACQ